MERFGKPTYDELESYIENLQKQCADAQATVEALQAIIKQMGEQACVLAKDGMAAKAQVDALQRERDEAIEALDCVLTEKPLPSGEYVHRVSCNGDRRKPAGTVGVSCSCHPGRAALDAERTLNRTLDAQIITLANQADEAEKQRNKAIVKLDAERERNAQLQALVRVYFTEPDPHKWTAAYQTLKRMGLTLPANSPEEGGYGE